VHFRHASLPGAAAHVKALANIGNLQPLLAAAEQFLKQSHGDVLGSLLMCRNRLNARNNR
jgi:hypothetical protein